MEFSETRLDQTTLTCVQGYKNAEVQSVVDKTAHDGFLLAE